MAINKGYLISEFLFAVTVLFLPSCIYDNDSGSAQFAVSPEFVDTDGTVLSSDSLSEEISAYLYIDNEFSNIVTASSDGSYQISFYKGSTASLVMMAYTDNDSTSDESTLKKQVLRSISDDGSSISITTPEVGDNINNYAITINSTSNVDNFYYGRFDYDPDSSSSAWEQVETLKNMRAHVYVVVEELREVYGTDGDYSVELSGLHSSFTFAGKTSGDSITATPDAEFLEDGDLMSDKVSTWPTKEGESVTLSIYKDGNRIWESNKDSSGNSITLSAGDDKVFLVNCSQENFYITVIPWETYSQNSVFY